MTSSPKPPPRETTRSRTGLVSLTYVSDCVILISCQAPEVASLLDKARRFNLAHGITGALLFTGTQFVQTLEGRERILDALMRRIEIDPRHTRPAVIDSHRIAERSFPRWSMAYSGPSLFVSQAVSRALEQWQSGKGSAVAQLLTLMTEFARQSE